MALLTPRVQHIVENEQMFNACSFIRNWSEREGFKRFYIETYTESNSPRDSLVCEFEDGPKVMLAWVTGKISWLENIKYEPETWYNEVNT
jgi:hypothetical protein